MRPQFEDVTDVAPTILEAAGLPQPTEVNGVKQQRVDGMSMLDTFASATAPSKRTTQYFEMMGNRSIYHDGWMASARSGLLPWVYAGTSENMMEQPWELYDLSKDYSEANNLAQQYPDKVKEMQVLFDEEAKKNQVYPLDPRMSGRGLHVPAGHSTFYTSTGHLYNELTPPFETKSHTITAHVEIPKQGANGVLAAVGGEGGGFSLFLRDGRPTYTYNFFRQKMTTITAPSALPPGPATIVLHVTYSGTGVAKTAVATLSVNGRAVGTAQIPQTVPNVFSFEETFDVGEDSASPVGAYESPFPFTGTIQRIDVEFP